MSDRPIDLLAQFVSGRYEAWRAARSTLERQWMKFYRMYRLIPNARDKIKSKERSQIKIPATKEAINMAVDSMHSLVYPGDRFFDIKARQSQFEPAVATLRDYFDYLFETEQFAAKDRMGMINKCIYGTQIKKIKVDTILDKRMKQETTLVPSYDAVQGQVIHTPQTQMVPETVKINRPLTAEVSIFDFFIDPVALGAQHDEGCEGCIEQSMSRRPHLKKLEREGVISGVDLIKSGGQGEIDYRLRERLMLGGLYPTQDADNIHLMEWWGWIPEDKLTEAQYQGPIQDGGAEVFMIIANRCTVLKCVPNPFPTQERPFLVDRFEHVPGEFYGAGICEVANGPQRALDATVRSRLDNKAFAINQMFAINTRNLVAGQNLETHPGKTFLTTGPIGDSIQAFSVPDVTSGSYQEAQEYERYIQSSHGISRMVGGMPGKKGEQTATEVSALMQQSGARIRALVKSHEDNIIKPLLYWYYMISTTYLNVPEIFEVAHSQTGVAQLQTITPAQIKGEFLFTPMGSITMSAKAQQQKRMQALQLFANPAMAPHINMSLLIKKIYQDLDLGDEDQIINAIPMIPLQMAQAMMGGTPTGATPGIASQPALETGPKQPGTMLGSEP